MYGSRNSRYQLRPRMKNGLSIYTLPAKKHDDQDHRRYPKSDVRINGDGMAARLNGKNILPKYPSIPFRFS